MKKEQIIMVLGLAVVVLIVTSVTGLGKIKQLKNEVAKLNQVIKEKDVQIKTDADQLQAKQGELDSVKQKLASAEEELAGVKQDIGYINKKMESQKEMSAPAAAKPAVRKY